LRHPVVAILGRPNVGKSTLFNRVLGERIAVVDDRPGVTKDRHFARAEWNGRSFMLVDTGGFLPEIAQGIEAAVRRQAEMALEASTVTLLVVDAKTGVTDLDGAIARLIQKGGHPAILVVNKADDPRVPVESDFWRLGLGDPRPISSEQGIGIGDLLDHVVSLLPVPVDEIEDEGSIRVAIVGRPNVGKSSLLNRLLKAERSIVSDTPGTTRDTVDAVLKWHKRSFRIVDTAGIRRPGRVARSGQLESLSVILARRAIAKADVAVLVIDASIGTADQDGAIAGEAEKAGCGIVIAANKWDLMKDRGPDFYKTFDAELRRQLKFLEYAPILHISAATGERATKVLEAVDKVAAARSRRIPTGELNRFVQQITAEHPPKSPGRRAVRVLYAAQIGTEPPTFVFFTNVATEFHFSYERFLVNRLRESFGLLGTPIRVQVRKR
jgi:GTP-binding protein